MKVEYKNEQKYFELFKVRRSQLRLSQMYVAHKLGISPMSLSHFETGRRMPKINILEKWANILDLEIKIEFINKTNKEK